MSFFHSESGSMEQINSADVDDKEVLEGLFKENKEILAFLSSGLAANNAQAPTRGQVRLGQISEDRNDDVSSKYDRVKSTISMTRSSTTP